MIAKYLWETGSFIITIMGILHLRGTLFTNVLHPRNEKLVAEMQVSPLILTEKLTMWKSWIGFNASHSSGVIFVGVVNFYLAFHYFEILQSDPFFFLFTILTMGFYVWVAKKYWFKTVLIFNYSGDGKDMIQEWKYYIIHLVISDITNILQTSKV
jgi:hypothetical protein